MCSRGWLVQMSAFVAAVHLIVLVARFVFVEIGWYTAVEVGR